MSIYVETDCQVFAQLNVKLFNAVFSKHTEHALARELARNLDDIVL